jgi:ribosome-associated protein
MAAGRANRPGGGVSGFDPERELPLREIQFQFVRSSGAGGQNVNKVSSKAVLRWNVRESPSLPQYVRARLLAQNARRVTNEGELVLTSQRFRDQGRNVADCLEKLHALVRAASFVPKARHATRPTRGSRERRLDEKKRKKQTKAMRGAPRGRGED